MIATEMKINAIMRAMTAEDSGTYEAAMAQIREYMKSAETQERTVDVEECIGDILLELCVPNHLKGYPYLLTAIRMAVEEPDILDMMVKRLYCDVGKAHNTTPSRAERAIRHAIETCWDRIDPDTMFHYFGNSVSPSKGKPVNAEFIARVANVVRRRMKDAA